jgi:hypothetical protein
MNTKGASNKIIKMGIDLYNWHKDPSKINFSTTSVKSLEEAEVLFRQTLLDECGIKDGVLDWKNFSNPIVKWKMYTLTAETIDAIVPAVIKNQFDRFVETKNAAWNEQLIFKVNSPDIFRVDKVANGNTNIRSQRLDQRVLRLSPVMRAVKIEESLYRVLAGEVDWATYINRVAVAMSAAIKGDIANAIYSSYNGLDSQFQESGSFTQLAFNTLVANVQAANGGAKPVAFGTKLALQKVIPVAGFTAYPGYMSPNMMDEYNMSGFLGYFQGTPLIELEQAYVPGTLNFAIPDNYLLVIPAGTDKIVKLGFEGESLILDNANDLAADQTLEYTFQKAWDVNVLSAGRYGLFQLS